MREKPMRVHLRATATGSAILTRSSAYDPPTSCTQAPSRRSIAGITCISSTRGWLDRAPRRFEEIVDSCVDECASVGRALLRVKLDADRILAANHRREGRVLVRRRCEHGRFVVGLTDVGVGEV